MFADRLKKLRKKLGLTQKELAEILNTSRSTIAGYESPSKLRMPNTEKLRMMASLFNVSIDYLLCRDTKNKTEPAYNLKENIPEYNYFDTSKDIYPILVENDKYAHLGILCGDLLLCKYETHASQGDLAIIDDCNELSDNLQKELKLAFIKNVKKELYEIYIPASNQSSVLDKDQLKAVIYQVIHRKPSLSRYQKIRNAIRRH